MFGMKRQSAYTSGGGGATITDPLFSSVSLLLKANGTNGSTSIIDSSVNARTQVSNRAMTIDTANAKYGTGGLYSNAVNNGGSGEQNGAYVEYPSSSAFNFAIGDWCVDWWMKIPTDHFANNSNNLNTNLTYTPTGECGNIYFTRTTVGIYPGAGSPNYPAMTLGINIDDGQWHHYVIQRASGVTVPKMWFDGVEKSVPGSFTWSSNTSAPNFQMGRSNVGSWFRTGYWYDDFRITRAIRYTTDFTPSEAGTQ
jgi:hypothetical protein